MMFVCLNIAFIIFVLYVVAERRILALPLSALSGAILFSLASTAS
jgi:hypothetical protein